MNAVLAWTRSVATRWGDWLLAAAATAYGVVSLVSSTDSTGVAREPDALAYLLAVVMAAPLAVRRRWPIPVLGIFIVGLVAFSARGYGEANVDFFGPVIGVYTVASQRPLRIAVLAAAACAIAVGISFLVEPNLSPTAGDWLTLVAFVVGTTFVGDSVRRRRAYSAALEARTVELEGARTELARRAVTEERLRMARELHDVVAHTMTAIVVQSAVAQRSLAASPPQAAAALENIETMSRQGLAELRSILDVLRAGDDDSARLAPTARLSDIDALAERLRSSGMDLAVKREGDLTGLSPLVELAAYRIVQEALTNALRYADGARVVVSIRGDAREVAMEIRDFGGTSSGQRQPFAGAGKGLAGMEERASLLGGAFEAGPIPGGGFVVAARLPRGGAS